VKRLVVLAVAAVTAVGCGEDAAPVDNEAVAQSVVPADSVPAPSDTSTASVVTTTAPAGDFGSRYVGSPVAFWFWAPY